MLTLTSHSSSPRYCDGLSRRSFLRLGALGLSGLTLPDLLRAEAGLGRSSKALILVYFQEVFATVYHALGIHPNTTTIPDLTGRPHYLVDGAYQPMKELIA